MDAQIKLISNSKHRTSLMSDRVNKIFNRFSSIHRGRDALIPAGDSFAFYKISFQWYSVIGVVATWIPAIIISHLTGGTDAKEFNVQLLSPVIRKWMPQKYQHTKLELIKNHINAKCNDSNLTMNDHEMTRFTSTNDVMTRLNK